MKKPIKITILKKDLQNTPTKEKSKSKSRNQSPELSKRKSSRIADVFEKTQYMESKEFWEK